MRDVSLISSKRCIQCNRLFTKKTTCSKKDWINTKYCSRKCVDKAKKGKPSQFKGKKRPNLSGANNGSWKGGKKICRDCGKIRNTYEKCNGVCKECWGKRNRGSSHFNWKGGITSLSSRIRHLFKYRQWRSDIFTRDDYTCQICGLRGGELNVDHYPKMFSEIFKENNIKTLEEAEICEEFWNINNGRTLCKKCHQFIHKK